MEARIQKWGNSLALRIPKALAAEAHLTQEGVVDLAVAKGKLVIAPAKRRKFVLAEMVAGITDENRPHAEEWDAAVGREVW